MALPEELSKLLEAGVHFGHKAKRWNPRMKKFIFGKRSGIYIIDLEQTLEKIKEAQNFLSGIVKDGGELLFVGTKKQAQGIVKEIAESYDMPYVVTRWVGGFLTNASTVRKRIEKYKELLNERDNGGFDRLPKKEVVRLNKDLERMEHNFSGVKNMNGLPSVLIAIDPKKEELAIREAKRVGKPIVALIDTDSDPGIIDYPIPCNDDALRSIKTVLSFLMDPLKEIIDERQRLIDKRKQEAEKQEQHKESEEKKEKESEEKPETESGEDVSKTKEGKEEA